ncbi:MAG: hypothetical protein E6896_03660 [Clostridium butyricum]|nr:hypothetical protein [Clostridium butyricum]
MSKLYFFGLNKIFIKKYIKEGRVDRIPYDKAVLAASLRLYSSFELKFKIGLNFKLINLFMISIILEYVIISDSLDFILDFIGGLFFFWSVLSFFFFNTALSKSIKSYNLI